MANCTENRVCTSCDTVVPDFSIKLFLNFLSKQSEPKLDAGVFILCWRLYTCTNSFPYQLQVTKVRQIKYKSTHNVQRGRIGGV